MKAIAPFAWKIWLRWRDFGPDEVLCRSVSRLGWVSPCKSLDIYVKELGSDLPQAHPNGILFREVSWKEVWNFRFSGGLPSLEEIWKNFDRGSRLFAALESDTVVAVNWMNLRSADLTAIHLSSVTVPGGAVYSHGAFVSPAFRNRGIGTRLKQTALNTLQREGVQFAFVAVFLEDIRVHRWHLANGFQKWGRVTHFRWGEKDQWWTRLSATGQRYPALLGISSSNHA